jgi:hypothetical protein
MTWTGRRGDLVSCSLHFPWAYKYRKSYRAGPSSYPLSTLFGSSKYREHFSMNQQDRKRAFGKAFHGVSNTSSHPHRKALRSVAASHAVPTPQIFYAPTFPFDPDKENEMPYLSALDEFAKPFDGSKQCLLLPPRTSSLRGLAELPVVGHGFDRAYAIPQMDTGQDLRSPPEQVLGAYTAGHGPIIFEDPVSNMGPLTPSALHFQTLSLLDPPRRCLPDLTSQSAVDINATRTSVLIMQSTDLQ